MTEKAIIFDSGALISFSMNGITYLIKELKGIFKGKFLITSEIKKEIIDVPMKIKRFELEALKLKQLLDEGILELPSSLGIKDSEITNQGNKILKIANSTFQGTRRDLHLLDLGETSCLALSRILTQKKIKNVLVVDERTTRMLVEKPENLKSILEKKIHTKISIKQDNLKFFKGFGIIRSSELVYIAYKKGLVKLKDGNVLNALLYAVKFKGAAISSDEIEEIKRLG
ncbi:hypothetical protein ES703_24496 [subsurface metagenome]